MRNSGMPTVSTGQKAPRTGSCSLWILARPRSSREGIKGWDENGFLEILLKSPPAEGRANQECRAQLARALGLGASQIVLLKGHASRKKRILIQGLAREEVERRVREWLHARKG